MDTLNGELLKTLNDYGKYILFRIIGKAYETGKIPKDFEKRFIIRIPKMRKVEICEKYRTISLTTHAPRVLTKIMHKKIVRNNVTEDQFGFRKNKGTREAILY